ncbi:hypothetical protein CIB48_g12321 [Xylaria polymorpha]|nr:hypothetical protein CIB48_g12321 [Xylaria polymorpha]
MAQKVLQANLSMGMSVVSGAHSSKLQPVPEDYNGLKHVIPDSITPQLDTRYTLRGKDGNDIQMHLLCWGAWPWGDTSTFRWSDDELLDIRAVWKKCLENGLTFVDTAQVYGSGKSEEILTDLIHNYSSGADRSKIIVQTKWPPNVTDQGANVLHPVEAPFKQLQKTSDRMKLTHIDCYLVHGHIHISSIKQVAKGLAKCVEAGLTKTVGVANYFAKDMLQMKEALAKHGIPLATNQCEYSILRRMPETEGMLEACRENDIVFLSHSSIDQGRLSGKYGKDKLPPKEYRFSSYDMERVERCLQVQRKLAEKYNVSVAAVAPNWNICKGAIPMVGVKKEEQAVENMQAFGWRLTREEISESRAIRRFFGNRAEFIVLAVKAARPMLLLSS